MMFLCSFCQVISVHLSNVSIAVPNFRCISFFLRGTEGKKSLFGYDRLALRKDPFNQ